MSACFLIGIWRAAIPERLKRSKPMIEGKNASKKLAGVCPNPERKVLVMEEKKKIKKMCKHICFLCKYKKECDWTRRKEIRKEVKNNVWSI